MPNFLFVANDAPLDFVNTEVILAGARTDLLQSFENLAQWFEQANLASATEMQRFAKVWTDISGAKETLQAARALRSVLRNAVEQVAGSGRIPSDLAIALTKELRQPRLATDVVTATDLRGKLKNYLKQVRANRVVLVENRRQSPKYLVDKEFLDSLVEERESILATLEILTDRDLADRLLDLAKTIDGDVAAGRLLTTAEVFGE
jgi:hypothetical protein